MDKSTIRVYGWIVIAVIVAGVIISSMAMFADDVLQSLHILPENIENRYESGLPAGAVGSLNTPENLNLSEDYIFSFDAVPGADRYVVTIESNGVTTLKTTSSTFVDCAVELDTIKSYATIAVKAVSSSPDVKDSETAVYFIIRTLGVTSNIQLDSDYLLTFNAVDFANRYTIKIDGVTVCTTDTTSVSLAEYLSDKKGSVDISVIADDATGKYFSGEEAKLRVALTYTVQYISNGSTIKTEYVKVALPHSHASFNLHSLSDTDDQAFRGWENEGETYEGGSYVTITSDVTYTAKWVNIYTIEFKVNGETISEIITEGDVEIPTYTPDENHEFDGWKAGDTIYAPGEHVQFTEDTILDAVLVPIYDVTVKYNDGTTSDTSYTTRGSVTLPATPTRSGYYFLGWSDGVSTYQAGNVHVISKDTTYTAVWGKICSIPSVDGSLVYNGGVQSPNWLNLDASAITVGGQTSATNAGVYVTTFTPNSGFVWNDGTATTKSISWEIAKANGSVTLSATSGTITYPGEGNFTAAGTGALSVESSDTAIATANVADGKITVVPGTTAGTTTITVTSAATTNHKAATATYKVTVKLGSLPPLVSASGYFGTYDGSPHGITVTCDGATIKYGTTEGEYPLTNSPTFTDVPTDGTGRYVVYFQVSKPGYETYTSSLPVVISRAPIAVKPSQHGTLLYNGTRLTPAWDNFNSSQLTIGGVTSAIDAGTYRASFTPTSNYKWSDGSTGSYSVFWTIDSEPAPGWYFPEQWEALWRGESVAPEYPWGWLNGDYLFVDNGTTYGDTDYIGGDLEDGMLAFPSDGTVTCIGAYGFANLGNLCGVYIPSTITTIEEFAFDFCENIYDFRIAKGLKYLEGPLITCGGATIVDEITYYGTIADWRSIAKDPTWTKGLWKTDIVCTDGNVLKPGLYVDGEYVETWDHLEQRSWVTLTNSVLTGVDFSYYDAYSENVHLVMDDSVTAISNSAFSQNSCITGITISNRVTELQSFVFGRCASLKAIVIPDSVTVLGNAVFDDTSLESIIYEGTIQDWKNIDMGIWWESNYDLPIDRITCLDGYIYRVKFLSGYSTTATYWLENGEKVPYVEVDNDAIDSNYWFSFDSWFYGTTEYIGDADMTYLISVTTDKNGNAVESNLIVNQPITLTAATYKIVNIIAKDIKNSEYICDQIVLPSSNLTGTLPSEVNVEGWLVTGFYRTNSSGTKVNYSLGGNFTLSSTDSATVDIYCNQRSTRVMIAWYFHIYESYNSTTYKTKDGPYYEYIDPSVTPYLHQSNWGKKYSELNPNMSIDYEKMYTKKPTAYKYGQQQSFTSKTGATSTSWLDGYYLDLSQHKGAFVEVYVPVYPRFQHFNLVLNDDDTNTNTYYTFKLNYGAETFSFQGQLYDGTVPADIFDGFCVTTAWHPNPSNSHTSGIAPSTTFSRTYNIEPGVTNYMLIEGYWERSGMYVPGTGTQIMSWSEMKNMGLVLDSKLSTLLFDLGDLHFLPITEWWDALMNDKSIINMDFKFDADAAFAGSKNTLYGFLKYCEDNGITRNGYKITTDLMFDLYIPEDSNLKTVAPWACAFTNAKAVYLPSTVTNIGDGAFTHCYFLNQLTLPSGLVNLGKGAFSFSQLNRVEIPAGVKTIPNDAFSGCTSLEYVTFLGNNVMSIGDRAFMYCESLKTITTKTTANALPSSLETIGAQAFCLCQNMTKLTIPARVTTIGMYAFALWDMPDYFTPFGVQIGTADGAFCGITIKDNYAGAGKGTTIRFEGVPIWGFPLGMMAFNTATIETAATILDWTAFMSWKTVIPWADYRGTSVVCSNGKFPIKYFI